MKADIKAVRHELSRVVGVTRSADKLRRGRVETDGSPVFMSNAASRIKNMKSPSGCKRRASGCIAISEERIAGAKERTLRHHRCGREEDLGFLASVELSTLRTGETIDMPPSLLLRRKNSSLVTNSNRVVAGLAGGTGPGTEGTTAGNVQSVN